MERRAIVTGATGLLGGNLCRSLVRDGWTVKAVVRSPEKAQRLLGDLDLTVVRGDMTDIAAFAPALEEGAVLFHTAAFFREYYQPGKHWETMKRINVDGTMELLRQAESRGVARTVFTSSSGVIQTRPTGAADESAPYSSFAQKNLYFKTKVLAEQEIERFLRTSRMDVVLILPGWMMGPGDAAPTSAGQLILDLLAKKLPALIDGGSSLADARDVADAMVTAASRGGRGERYIVTGPLATMRDIAATLESLTGVAAPTKVMPNWLAKGVARVSDTWAALTGTPTRMPVAGIATMIEKAQLDSAKAQRELGATFRPLSVTLSDTVGWYRANGYLPSEAIAGSS